MWSMSHSSSALVLDRPISLHTPLDHPEQTLLPTPSQSSPLAPSLSLPNRRSGNLPCRRAPIPVIHGYLRSYCEVLGGSTHDSYL